MYFLWYFLGVRFTNFFKKLVSNQTTVKLKPRLMLHIKKSVYRDIISFLFIPFYKNEMLLINCYCCKVTPIMERYAFKNNLNE